MIIKSKILMKGCVRAILTNSNTLRIVKDTGWIDNVILNTGRTELAANLVGKNLKNNPGQITYCALGSGTETPNVNGTELSNEFFRITIASTSDYADSVAEVRAFFNEAEGNGIIEEIGFFGEEATATTDSGTFFQWVSLSLTKTDNETMTIYSKIPFNYEA